MIVRGLHQGARAVLSGMGAAALVVAALYRPWLGAASVAATSSSPPPLALMPLVRLHWFALSAAAAGGVVAADTYWVARSGARAEIRANLTSTALHNELPAVPSHRAGHPSVPYALAIAAGAAFTLLATSERPQTTMRLTRRLVAIRQSCEPEQ